MHEIGHAEDFSKHRALKGVGLKISRGRGPAVAGVAAIGALSHDKTRDYAVPITSVPVALMLREEFAANHNAYKAIKKFNGASAARKFATGTGLKNMGNYGAAGAATIGAMYAGKKILDVVAPRHIEKKGSIATIAKKVGDYSFHQALVPGAVIFSADVGAHLAADNLMHKEEGLKKLAKKLASN